MKISIEFETDEYTDRIRAGIENGLSNDYIVNQAVKQGLVSAHEQLPALIKDVIESSLLTESLRDMMVTRMVEIISKRVITYKYDMIDAAITSVVDRMSTRGVDEFVVSLTKKVVTEFTKNEKSHTYLGMDG